MREHQQRKNNKIGIPHLCFPEFRNDKAWEDINRFPSSFVFHLTVEEWKYFNHFVLSPQKRINTIEVRVEDETVWLNKEQISTLFGRDRNIFREGELQKDMLCA